VELKIRLKKDYTNYLLSIIIPITITAISIPLFKNILGAEKYGFFSITFNILLLVAATLTGWISQSVVRLYPISNDKYSFTKKTFIIAAITIAGFSIPVIFSFLLYQNDWIMSILFCIALFSVVFQFVALPLSQAAFLSKKNIYSELLRTISYITVACLLLYWLPFNYMYSLFTAIIISYLLSAIYLSKQIRDSILNTPAVIGLKPEKENSLASRFFKYGAPLSLWFIFAYLLTISDKLFILKNSGAEIQGNYQAMFDLLNKGITIFISPVAISLMPLLSASARQAEYSKFKKLLFLILSIEVVVMFLVCILYWCFGAAILFKLIHIPNTREYKLMGLFIIAGSFLWQMAIVAHKIHEIGFKSLRMLAMVIIAFAFQLCFYLLNQKNHFPLIYPLGYALSALLYLILVSVENFKPAAGYIYNKFRNKNKLLQ
jgi:O-antigen/teichoic acid export membrane protein